MPAHPCVSVFIRSSTNSANHSLDQVPTGAEKTPMGILDRIASGDETAMSDCLSQYGSLVWSIVRRRCANPTDAEDAVQDIFMDIWKSAGRYRATAGAESTFVAMIARRRMIDRLRRKKTRPSPSADNVDELVQPRSDDLRRIDDREQATLARELMNQLKPDERRVLELAIDGGLTHANIATHMRLPLGTVKTHARRGMIRLRELFNATQEKTKGGN